MPFIDWNDEFAVGITDVDVEHRDLLDQINGLYEQVRAEIFGVTVADFLEELSAVMQEHFAQEEELMIEHAYPDHLEHKADHERFIGRINKLIEEYHDGVNTNDTAMSSWFTHWFRDHFQKHDARLPAVLGQSASLTTRMRG